jgi:thiol-disulfide isomerase/thioredoxin
MPDLAVPRVRAPDFPTTLDWVHPGPVAPTLAALRGRVVVLDFWTAGCINCRHLVPELHALHARTGDALALLGVHCGKYPAERDTAFIADACDRLGIAHPVLNDRQFRTWRAYAVRAWPTVVVIDAAGLVVGMHAGEITAEALHAFVAPLLRDAGRERPRPGGRDPRARHDDGDDDRRAARIPPSAAPGTVPSAPVSAQRGPSPETRAAATTLRHPSALALHPTRPGLVAIADTGHRRLLVATLDAERATATIVHARDGWPDVQGLAWGDDDTLLVAATGAHRVHALDVRTGDARVLAGTGVRVRTDADRAAGAMASPWGLARVGDALHVAMAGTHQLWTHDIARGTTRLLAGSGGEAIVDGVGDAALLAQPTALATDGTTLWVACAEGNAVRAVDPATATVTTLVGTGLFDFGHVDGTGDAVRLQHPEGLAWDARHRRLVIADSYNGALRTLDAATRTVTTLARGLDHPTGVVALGDGTLLVAETRAHRLLLVAADGTARRPVLLATPGAARATDRA